MKFLFSSLLLLSTLLAASQEFDRDDLPTEEFLSVELDFGQNLTFYVTGFNYKDDIELASAAKIIIKSNEDWILYWSASGNDFFNTDNEGSSINVGKLSIQNDVDKKSTSLAAREVKILNGIATMPQGNGDNEKYTICHAPGTDEQKSLKVNYSGKEFHLSHGDYEGKCAKKNTNDSDETIEDDDTNYDSKYYSYDKMCYDTRYGKYLPCKEYTFTYILNLRGDMPAPSRYNTEIIYTITAK